MYEYVICMCVYIHNAASISTVCACEMWVYVGVDETSWRGVSHEHVDANCDLAICFNSITGRYIYNH